MGKKIDRFVLTLVLALAFYLYFFFAFENHAAAIVLSLAACYLLLRLFGRIWAWLGNCTCMQRRRIRRSASGAVMKIACLPNAEAKEEVYALLKRCYGEEYCVELIQVHPSLQLSAQQLFEIWKEYQGLDRLVVCATCAADDKCRTMASAMKSPQLALIDASALEQMIAEHPEKLASCDAPAVHRKLRLRRVAHLIVNRRNAPKNLLLAGSMLMMYLLSANAFYLLSAMGLVFLAMVSLRRNQRPVKLF